MAMSAYACLYSRGVEIDGSRVPVEIRGGDPVSPPWLTFEPHDGDPVVVDEVVLVMPDDCWRFPLRLPLYDMESACIELTVRQPTK